MLCGRQARESNVALFRFSPAPHMQLKGSFSPDVFSFSGASLFFPVLLFPPFSLSLFSLLPFTLRELVREWRWLYAKAQSAVYVYKPYRRALCNCLASVLGCPWADPHWLSRLSLVGFYLQLYVWLVAACCPFFSAII